MTSQQGGNAFLDKAYALIETCPVAIGGWSDNGQSFFIKDEQQFAALLPKFFRHNNLKSFVRQLNLYGFHKLRNTGALVASSSTENPKANWIEFRHDRFIRGNLELIKTIQRRVNDPSAKASAKAGKTDKAGDADGVHDHDNIEEAFRDRIDMLEVSIRSTQSQALQFSLLLEQCSLVVKALPPLSISPPLSPHARSFGSNLAECLLRSAGSASAAAAGPAELQRESTVDRTVAGRSMA